jgi:DNA ligase-1
MKKFRNQNVIGYWMSEKYDGIQGQWDGKVLRTREGNIIHAPKFWTNSLPDKNLIGELWIGRNKYSETWGIISKRNPDESEWQKIRFMLFDGEISGRHFGKYAKRVTQIKIKSQDQFDEFYRDVIDNGGEGIVIETPDHELMKKKPISDDDGMVVGYKKGTGRNEGLVSALIIRLRDNREMKIGGLDDKAKSKPPRIGKIIKFKYQGFTSKGLPRFASYNGIRMEKSLSF